MMKTWKNLPYNEELKIRSKELRKSENLSEVLLWQQLKSKKLLSLDFDRQKIIGNYIVDFYCSALGVIIEIDGYSHDFKVQYDQKRDVYLQQFGLVVLHVLDIDIKQNLSGVLAYLTQALHKRINESSIDDHSVRFASTPSQVKGHLPNVECMKLQQMPSNQNLKKVSAFAPATSANFAVGFDLIGFAIAGVGDKVHLQKRTDDQLIIQDIKGVLSKADLSSDVDKNVCGAVIKKFLTNQGLTLGLDIVIEKGIPLGSGIGGSAASSVAAILAVNEFLAQPLSKEQLIDYAIYGESLISGGVYHGDNAVPAMFGGLVLLQSSKPCEFIKLPTLNLYASIVVPDLKIETKEARKLIDLPFNIKDVVAQSAKIAAVVSALYEHDIKRFKRHFVDVLIEPKRKVLITGFDHAKTKAYALGALGLGISGSGPAVFALSEMEQKAQEIALELTHVFAKEGLLAKHYVTKLDAPGAEILEKEEA